MSEKLFRDQILDFKAKFHTIRSLSHREGDWLKNYSVSLLNFMDIVDQMPISLHEKSFGVVEHVHDIARILIEIGDYFSGIDVFQRIAARCLSAKNYHQAGMSFNMTGVTYNQLGLFDKAEASFEWALRIYQNQLHDEIGSLVTLNNYGFSLIRTQRWAEAEQTFNEVMKRLKKIPDQDVRTELGAPKIGLIATLYQNFGKLCLNRAEEAFKQKLPYRHFAEEACRNLNESIQLQSDVVKRTEAESDFAEALYFMEQYTDAERLLKHLEKKCLGAGPHKKLLANIYRRLAMIKLVDDQVDEAMDLCYRALEISLLFTNPVEETDIIDTYIDILRISASILFKDAVGQIERVKIASSRGYKLVDNLVGFLEKKDLYTGLNHSFNVCQLSVRMGEIIRENASDFCLDPASQDPENMVQLDLLGLAGMLHDIGKLQLPWGVINKILPLKEEEWLLIKQHPINGFRMLNSFYLEGVGKIVVEHHEKVDGSGYPWGRKSISLMGAIIALADVYEAMTTINRQYRKSKTKENALREINDLAGVHFDKRAVKALTMAMT